MIGIYKIVCKKTGKCYVGSSIDTLTRWKKHLWCLENNMHHSNKLQNAWNKYGKESFAFDIIEELPDASKLIETEQKHIDKLKAASNGYNIKEKADKQSSPSEKTKQKISLNTKKGMEKQEVRKKLIKNQLGW